MFCSAITGANPLVKGNVGGGLLIPDINRIDIHSVAIIGPNCLILQKIIIRTIVRVGKRIVNDHVDMVAAAKDQGGIRIGVLAQIGVNAVVQIDVPTGEVTVGTPAKFKT